MIIQLLQVVQEYHLHRYAAQVSWIGSNNETVGENGGCTYFGNNLYIRIINICEYIDFRSEWSMDVLILYTYTVEYISHEIN